VLAALDRPGDAAGEVFNIGEHASFPVGGYARAILAAAGHEADLVRVTDDALPPDLKLTGGYEQQVSVSSAKATRALGWRPADPVAGIERSVRWHLEHPPADPDTDFTADDAALAESDQ
jgi:nucleoside-diphosphate-sugar epimerase